MTKRLLLILLLLVPLSACSSSKSSNLDRNRDGRITCADFDSPVTDSVILNNHPNLDGDHDGIGCELNGQNR